MSTKFTNLRNITLRILLVSFFIIALIGLIAYARGYRFNFENDGLTPNGITSTGIVSVSAFPKSSKVYVNGKLKGVTDLNISLPPGEYKIEVKKEGYTEWVKTIRLKGEIVLTLDALLFPKNPSLISLTNIGIVKAVPYHEGNKIILFSENDDPEKDGIYLFDAGARPISFFAPLKLLVLKKYLPADIQFSQSNLYFSPDSQQAIFEFPTSTGLNYSYLFTFGEEITQPFDISSSKDALIASWQIDKNKEVTKILETFPKKIRPIAANNFSIISFSPDQTKVLYQAKTAFVLPPIITPALIGTNQTEEARSLQVGDLYIYDKKEDKNYKIAFDDSLALEPTLALSPTSIPTRTPTPRIATRTAVIDPVTDLDEESTMIFSPKTFPIVWHSDSKHISIQQQKEIVMVDFDGINKRTIYSGPFENGFFFVTNNGKLYILTNLNPQNNKYSDLYEIGIQ